MKFLLSSLIKFTCLFVFFSLSGCGYVFQGSGSNLPPDVKRIYIPLAENETAEPKLAKMLTEALRDQFDKFGVLEVVDSFSEADAVLKAKIVKVKKGTASVTSTTDTATEFDTSVTMAANIKRVSGTFLWRNNEIIVNQTSEANSQSVVTGSTSFLSGSLSASDLDTLQKSGSIEVARGQQGDAFQNLMTQAAGIIYTNAVSPDF